MCTCPDPHSLGQAFSLCLRKGYGGSPQRQKQKQRANRRLSSPFQSNSSLSLPDSGSWGSSDLWPALRNQKKKFNKTFRGKKLYRWERKGHPQFQYYSQYFLPSLPQLSLIAPCSVQWPLLASPKVLASSPASLGPDDHLFTHFLSLCSIQN